MERADVGVSKYLFLIPKKLKGSHPGQAAAAPSTPPVLPQPQPQLLQQRNHQLDTESSCFSNISLVPVKQLPIALPTVL